MVSSIVNVLLPCRNNRVEPPFDFLVYILSLVDVQELKGVVAVVPFEIKVHSRDWDIKSLLRITRCYFWESDPYSIQM